jgi:hypothetical protein
MPRWMDVIKFTAYFFLIINQTLNYSNLFCYKTLHVSGIFYAHHQEFSTVHSSLLSFMQVDDHFQAVRMELQFHPDSAWMMGIEDARNM